MKLKIYLAQLAPDAREAFAESCLTSVGHLRNVGNGYRTCGTDLAVLIERKSDLAVRRWELRDDWFLHWPELIGAEGAPPIEAKAAA